MNQKSDNSIMNEKQSVRVKKYLMLKVLLYILLVFAIIAFFLVFT